MKVLAINFALLLAAAPAFAQQQNAAMQAATAEDHQQMMTQLGIKALRPGPSGNEKDANHANYDEALANPYPNLPPLMKLNDGRKVGTPQLWARRRAEFVE